MIFCVEIAYNVNAQNSNPSSITLLRGYVVRQYKKQDVISKSNSTVIQIDSYLNSYFMPFGEQGIDVLTDSLNVLHRDFIVFLPSKQTDDLIMEFCKDKSKLVTTGKRGVSYTSDSSYFEVKGKPDNDYLLKYYYTECRALKVTIDNNSYNAFRLNIPFNHKSVSKLTCYFIFDTTILQPIDTINSHKLHPFTIGSSKEKHEIKHGAIKG